MPDIGRLTADSLNSRDLLTEIYARFEGASGFARELKLVYDDANCVTKARLLDMVMAGILSLKNTNEVRMDDADLEAELKALRADPLIETMLGSTDTTAQSHVAD